MTENGDSLELESAELQPAQSALKATFNEAPQIYTTKFSNEKQELGSEGASEFNTRKKRRYSTSREGSRTREDEIECTSSSPVLEAEQSEANRSLESTVALPPLSRPTSRRPPDIKTQHEEENESACCECEGGGELVCCDTCIRAFHMVCLPSQYRPLEQTESAAVSLQWSCPVCLYFRVHEDLEKRRGVLLNLQHPLPVPSKDCDPRAKRLRGKKFPDNIASDEESAVPSTVAHRSQRFNHQDLYRESHHHYLFEDIRKQRSALQAASASTPSTEVTTTGVRTTRRAAAAAAAAVEKKSEPRGNNNNNAITSIGRMNVGPSFQIPQHPIPFLEVQDLGRTYEPTVKNRFSKALADTRVVYSVTDWKLRARSLGTNAPFENPNATSPFSTKKEHDVDKRDTSDDKLVTLLDIDDSASEDPAVLEARSDFVDTEEKLISFCQILASKWSTRCHWPYSSEYSYKILQYCGFNAKAALSCVEDPTFDFHSVCDPPVRPYFNKWRPKDKRSFFPSTPFPPPQHFRGAYSSVGTRTRLQVSSFDIMMQKKLMQQAAYGYR